MIFFAVDAPIPGTDCSSAALAVFRSTGALGAALPLFLADVLVAVDWALQKPGAASSKHATAGPSDHLRSLCIEKLHSLIFKFGLPICRASRSGIWAVINVSRPNRGNAKWGVKKSQWRRAVRENTHEGSGIAQSQWPNAI
jgi:hypothetical protein